MVWAAALALLAAGAPSAILDEELITWASPHAPNGLDIFPDGSVWISAGYDTNHTEYMMSAKDLRTSQGRGGMIWMRMDHRRDKTRPYRTSLERYFFDCAHRQYRRGTLIAYRADQTIYFQSGNGGALGVAQDVIPGTIGEDWIGLVCFADK